MENIQAGEYKFKTGLQQCTREFIDNCLKKNPRNRFSSEDIIRHEFFDEVRPFYSIKGTPFEINSQEEIQSRQNQMTYENKQAGSQNQLRDEKIDFEDYMLAERNTSVLGTDEYQPDPDYEDIRQKEISFNNIDELFEFDLGDVVDKIKEGTVTVGIFFKESILGMFDFLTPSPNPPPLETPLGDNITPAARENSEPLRRDKAFGNDEFDEGQLSINRRSLFEDKEVRGSCRQFEDSRKLQANKFEQGKQVVQMTYCPEVISDQLRQQNQTEQFAAESQQKQESDEEEGIVDKFLGFFGIGAKQTQIREHVKQKKIEKLHKSKGSNTPKGSGFENSKYKDSLSTNSSIPPHNKPKHLLLNGIDLKLGSFSEKNSKLYSDETETIIEGYPQETENNTRGLNFTKSNTVRLEYANSSLNRSKRRTERVYKAAEHDEDELECDDNFMERKESDSSDEEDLNNVMFSQLGRGNPFEEKPKKQSARHLDLQL